MERERAKQQGTTTRVKTRRRPKDHQQPSEAEEVHLSEQEVEEARSSFWASTYVKELYLEVNDCWERFRSSQKPSDLVQTATLLCDGLRGFQADATFWDGVDVLFRRGWQDGERDLEAASWSNEGFDELMAVEAELLTHAFGREKARKLVGDCALALDIAHRYPDSKTVKNLEGRMDTLCDAVCEAAQPSSIVGPGIAHPSGHRWQVRFQRYSRVVGRGVLFVGGGALVVVNSTAAIELPPCLASVMTGLGLMVQQVEKQEQELPLALEPTTSET